MPKNRKQNTNRSSRTGRRDSSRPGTGRSRRGRERHISVRGELRDKPDVGRIARAVIEMALAQAEAEAQAEARAEIVRDATRRDGRDDDAPPTEDGQ